MLRAAKVATPLGLVSCGVPPDRIPPVGFTPIDSVTEALGTRLRNASFTVTWTAGVMWRFVVVGPGPGCTVKAAVAGAAAVMLKATLSAPGVPVTAACSV